MHQVKSSYHDIVKASSITGVSAVLTLLVGAVSVKFGAIFLGVSGIGQLRLFQSLLSFCSSISLTLGAPATAVQELARNVALGNVRDVTSIVTTLRRVSVMVGLGTWTILAAVAWPLSRWMFGDVPAAWSIVLLGVALPLLAHGAAQMALLRGFRRIGAIARINVICATCSALVSIVAYWRLGIDGIVPALIGSAAVSTLVPTLLANRLLGVPTWRARASFDWVKARDFLLHGSSLTIASLSGAGVGLLIPGLIGHELGVAAAGLYAAAWGLSGLFANFILSAMGTDYLPRIAAVAYQRDDAERVLNEQTEVGLLLALPGLVATIVLAPYAIDALYSAEFRAAEALLVWFTVGVLLKVSSWPLAYILLAQRLTGTYTCIECGFSTVYVLGTAVALQSVGLPGVALAFGGAYMLYTISLLAILHWRLNLRWRRDTCVIAGLSAGIVAFAVAIGYTAGVWRLTVGAALIAGSLALCARLMSARLGAEHRAVRLMSRVPIVSLLVSKGSPRAIRPR
jgi:PST family polysaccharide transporter